MAVIFSSDVSWGCAVRLNSRNRCLQCQQCNDHLVIKSNEKHSNLFAGECSDINQHGYFYLMKEGALQFYWGAGLALQRGGHPHKFGPLYIESWEGYKSAGGSNPLWHRHVRSLIWGMESHENPCPTPVSRVALSSLHVFSRLTIESDGETILTLNYDPLSQLCPSIKRKEKTLAPCENRN